MHANNSCALCHTLHNMSANILNHFDLCQAFVQDAARFDHLSLHAPYVHADLSKQLWTTPIVAALQALADARELPLWRKRLLEGGMVNLTEARSADHAQWRLSCQQQLPAAMQDMLALAETIRNNPAINLMLFHHF